MKHLDEIACRRATQLAPRMSLESRCEQSSSLKGKPVSRKTSCQLIAVSTTLLRIAQRVTPLRSFGQQHEDFALAVAQQLVAALMKWTGGRTRVSTLGLNSCCRRLG